MVRMVTGCWCHWELPRAWRPTVHSQCQSETDTRSKERALSSEISHNERNNGWKNGKTLCSFFIPFRLELCPFIDPLIMWLSDMTPSPAHTRVWPLLSCLCPGGLLSWWEPHIIGFVVCANYIHHQSPIIGSLSHSNWDFLSPSCHHHSYQSGSVNIWGQDCFITGKCFLHDLTTCSESLPQWRLSYKVQRELYLLEKSLNMILKKSVGILIICPAVIWLPLPQISISLLAGNVD